MKFIFVCACQKIDERKIYLKLNLELVKADGYDIPQPRYGPPNSFLSPKRPSVSPDTECDMPVADCTLLLIKKPFCLRKFMILGLSKGC
jgi:hypothetical protein